MKSQKTTVEPSALLKAFGDITSTGQCSFSQIDEDKKDLVQLINDKLKSLPRFNYSSYTIFDRQQCKGMIRIFLGKPFWISLENFLHKLLLLARIWGIDWSTVFEISKNQKGLQKIPICTSMAKFFASPNEIDFFTIPLFFTLYNMLQMRFFASPFESSKFRNFENGFSSRL